MIAFPNCKINLGLFVTEKRGDGFHNIQSIFVPIPLCDVLEVITAEEGVMQFETSGIALDGEVDDNICVKAYRLLQRDFNLAGIKSHLLKNIPTGAGLGGGSSDGAIMLKLLNDVFALQLSNKDLKNYAAQLGSDCSFFIDSKTAFVGGRGELVKDLTVDLSSKTIVIVHPNIHVSTRKAYSRIVPKKAPIDLTSINTIPFEDWRAQITNDFEAPIFHLYPEIAELKNKLYDAGAFYASMSGSGSALYGIFHHEVENLQSWFPGCFYWKGTL